MGSFLAYFIPKEVYKLMITPGKDTAIVPFVLKYTILFVNLQY